MTIVNNFNELKNVLINELGVNEKRLNKKSDDYIKRIGYNHDIIIKSYYDTTVSKIKDMVERELEKYSCNDYLNIEARYLLNTYDFAFDEVDVANITKLNIIRDVIRTVCKQ